MRVSPYAAPTLVPPPAPISLCPLPNRSPTEKNPKKTSSPLTALSILPILICLPVSRRDHDHDHTIRPCAACCSSRPQNCLVSFPVSDDPHAAHARPLSYPCPPPRVLDWTRALITLTQPNLPYTTPLYRPRAPPRATTSSGIRHQSSTRYTNPLCYTPKHCIAPSSAQTDNSHHRHDTRQSQHFSILH